MRCLPLLPLVVLCVAANWPQWRGPARDGLAPDIKLPDKWPAEPPKPRWVMPVGQGYSGPAVADGRVYVMGRADGEEVCHCFDAATGKPLWKVGYPEPDFKPPTGEPVWGPQSTPTVDGDRVYFFGLLGMLHCLDAKTGAVRWKRDCHKEFWGVVKAEKGDDAWFPPCGCAAGPLVEGKTVILPVGGKKAGSFTAFDRDTGKIVWQALDERSSYASPVFAAPGGIKQLIGFTGLRMVGLDQASHKLLWDRPFKAFFEQTIVSPVVWNDLVVIGGEKRPTFALRLKSAGGKVETEEVWKNDDLKEYTTTPVLVGPHLVGHDARAERLVCLGVADGQTAWTSPRLGRYFSLLAAGDTVLALNNDGELFALKAGGDDYTQLAKWRVSDQKGTWAHPAVAGGKLFVKDKERLLCYDLPV
jgi:outer membrane protein assembly factor BamB